MQYKYTVVFSRIFYILFFIFTTLICGAQEFISISSEVYRPDNKKMDWVFDYKIEKENISVILKEDSLYIDGKPFRLSKIYETKESEDMKLERFYAYHETIIYHFDVFISKVRGEENIRMFYLTIDDSNYRYFCLRSINSLEK
jgi:hypothetical protein